MYYAIVRDDVIVAFDNIANLFPNLSFPADGPDDQFVEEKGLAIASSTIEFNSSTHRLVYCSPYILDGVVYYVKAEKLSKAQLDAHKAAIAEFEAMQGE
jgi:hypothetical protein